MNCSKATWRNSVSPVLAISPDFYDGVPLRRGSGRKPLPGEWRCPLSPSIRRRSELTLSGTLEPSARGACPGASDGSPTRPSRRREPRSSRVPAHPNTGLLPRAARSGAGCRESQSASADEVEYEGLSFQRRELDTTSQSWALFHCLSAQEEPTGFSDRSHRSRMRPGTRPPHGCGRDGYTVIIDKHLHLLQKRDLRELSKADREDLLN